MKMEAEEFFYKLAEQERSSQVVGPGEDIQPTVLVDRALCYTPETHFHHHATHTHSLRLSAAASVWCRNMIFPRQETQSASPGAAASISNGAREFIMATCDNQTY